MHTHTHMHVWPRNNDCEHMPYSFTNICRNVHHLASHDLFTPYTLFMYTHMHINESHCKNDCEHTRHSQKTGNKETSKSQDIWVDSVNTLEVRANRVYVGAQNLGENHIYQCSGAYNNYRNCLKIPGRGCVYIHGLFKLHVKQGKWYLEDSKWRKVVVDLQRCTLSATL